MGEFAIDVSGTDRNIRIKLRDALLKLYPDMDSSLGSWSSAKDGSSFYDKKCESWHCNLSNYNISWRTVTARCDKHWSEFLKVNYYTPINLP